MLIRPAHLTLARKAIAAALVLASASVLVFGGWADRIADAVATPVRIRAPGGLVVTYYEGTNFARAVCRRAEFRLFRDYNGRAPAPGLARDSFSARWEGWLLCPTDAEYEFYSQSDDGLRLLIDGEPVLDNWRRNNWATSGCHGSRKLARGPHHLLLEFFSSGRSPALRVRWSGGGIPDNTTVGGPYLRKREPARETL